MKKLLFSTFLMISAVSLQAEKRFKITDTCELILQKGDITQAHVDVIVNAANPQLQAGGGVCGAIFAAAGETELQNACYATGDADEKGIRCPVGHVVVTDGFQLKEQDVKHIIHAVGPDYRVKYSSWKPHDLMQRWYLYDTYKNALLAGYFHKISSIAFPFISSGIYEFPRELACDIALQSVIESTRLKMNFSGIEKKVREIRFILFNDVDYELFCKTADTYAQLDPKDAFRIHTI